MHKILLAALIASLLTGVSFAADNTAVDVPPIKQEWLDIARSDAQETGNTLDEQALSSALRTNELLATEAIRIGIDKRPDFAAREEIMRRELLASLLIKEHLRKNPVSEETLKAEYARIKAQRGDKEYSARHIQVKTEEEAKDVIAQLAKGADFVKLAKEKSLDASSKDKGGQLDWVGKNALKAPLGDALSRLQKGLFTTVPLMTDAGWHVLKLEGVRDSRMPAYEKIREQLRQRLRAQQANKYVESLGAQAKAATP